MIRKRPAVTGSDRRRYRGPLCTPQSPARRGAAFLRENTDGSLAIRGSGEISKFREVKVDGVTVDPVNYTVTEGSTIITFKPEYLKSLSAGNHSFELVWTDGTAATNFTVAENADQSAKSPKTGEDFSRTLCTVLLMVSCAGLAGMFAKRKRNHAR